MVDFVPLSPTCNSLRAAFASPLLCRFVAECAVANEISKAKRQTKFHIGHLRLANPTPMLLSNVAQWAGWWPQHAMATMGQGAFSITHRRLHARLHTKAMHAIRPTNYHDAAVRVALKIEERSGNIFEGLPLLEGEFSVEPLKTQSNRCRRFFLII